VDIDRISAVAKALGARRCGELLNVLEVRLHGLSAAIEALPANAADIVAALHQSRGSAASLGLVGLSLALTDIEAQVADLLSGSPTLPDACALACIKIEGRALAGYVRAALQAAAGHVRVAGGHTAEHGQASGISSR
jgi:hypothetical protein